MDAQAAERMASIVQGLSRVPSLGLGSPGSGSSARSRSRSPRPTGPSISSFPVNEAEQMAVRPSTGSPDDEADEDWRAKAETARQLTRCWRWATSTETVFFVSASPDLLWCRRVDESHAYVAFSLVWMPGTCWLPIREPHVSLVYNAELDIALWPEVWMEAITRLTAVGAYGLEVAFRPWTSSRSLKLAPDTEFSNMVMDLQAILRRGFLAPYTHPCELHVCWHKY